MIRSILPIPCYPTLRYISRQRQPPYLAHFSLMQSSCLRTKPTPKHLTPTKMQRFRGERNRKRIFPRMLTGWQRQMIGTRAKSNIRKILGFRTSMGGKSRAFAYGIEVWAALSPVVLPLHSDRQTPSWFAPAPTGCASFPSLRGSQLGPCARLCPESLLSTSGENRPLDYIL